MVRAATWLSITPEPERELPAAVATLNHGGTPPPAEVAAETERVERLILRGSERAWLGYLHGVVELIDSRAHDDDGDVQRARTRAAAVISRGSSQATPNRRDTNEHHSDRAAVTTSAGS